MDKLGVSALMDSPQCECKFFCKKTALMWFVERKTICQFSGFDAFTAHTVFSL